jgi:spermidine/putrescine transport system ATP-binding protein
MAPTRVEGDPPAGLGTPAIEVEGISRRFGDFQALSEIHLTVREGEFFSLLGPSGCGKTTLLRILAGLDLPDAGVIRIGGKDVADVPAHRRQVNTVFQSYALFPHMTVADNVAFGLRMKKVAPADVAARVRKALDLVQIGSFADRKPAQLSGGQKQRVALARALINEPQVLLLDEPLGALDLKLRKELQVELLDLQRRLGITFLYVTHDQEEALVMSDRIAVMRSGRIEQMDESRRLYERPRTRFAAEFLGDSNFLSGVPVAGGLRLASGETIRVSGRLPTGGKSANVAIRPEKMTIHSGRPDGGPISIDANSIAAKITTVVYAGPALTYLLETKDGVPLKVFAQNRDGVVLETGRDVVLTWAPDHTVTIED